MEAMGVEQRVLQILERITRTPEVGRRPDVDLYGLQLLDSLSSVELMLTLSTEFGIEISPAEFDRDEWSTPRRIVQDVEARLARQQVGRPA
jgi:D-alanine--poly(phosphoribitol) ligase subunit 2